MKTRVILLCALLASCGSIYSVTTTATAILVQNNTCTPGPCATIHVYGFPLEWPSTPNGRGRLDLGEVTGSAACLAIPHTGEFTVNTTKYTWDSSKPLMLGAVLSTDNPAAAGPTTTSFVPTSNSAWSVVLPGSGDVESSPGCVPS